MTRPVQTLDEVFCVSFDANAFEKKVNPSVLFILIMYSVFIKFDII